MDEEKKLIDEPLSPEEKSKEPLSVEDRLALLEEHHKITVALLRGIGDVVGLEIHQAMSQDGRVMIGWKQKTIVTAHPPGGNGRGNRIVFPGR